MRLFGDTPTGWLGVPFVQPHLRLTTPADICPLCATCCLCTLRRCWTGSGEGMVSSPTEAQAGSSALAGESCDAGAGRSFFRLDRKDRVHAKMRVLDRSQWNTRKASRESSSLRDPAQKPKVADGSRQVAGKAGVSKQKLTGAHRFGTSHRLQRPQQWRPASSSTLGTGWDPGSAARRL